MQRSESIDIPSMEIHFIVLEQSHCVLSIAVDDGME